MKPSRLPLLLLAAAVFSLACSPAALPTSVIPDAPTAAADDDGTASAEYMVGSDIAIMAPAPCAVRAIPAAGGYMSRVMFCTYRPEMAAVDARLTTLSDAPPALVLRLGKYRQGCRVVNVSWDQGLGRMVWLRLSAKFPGSARMTTDRCTIIY